MVKITPKIKKILENNPVALATFEDDKPYVVGVAFCKAVDNNKILITDNFMKSIIKNILKNDNVAMVVWNKKLEGYQFLGKAKYYSKGKWLDFVKQMKENKGLPAKGAILVTVKKIIESK